MPNYSYKVINESGKTVKGLAEAKDDAELAANLKGLGYYLVESKELKPKKDMAWGKVRRKDLISFSADLASMLDAGIPILDTLRDMITRTESVILKNALEKVYQDVSGGRKLSEALERQPKVFSDLYIHVIRAGETTGDVPTVLTHLSNFLSWGEDLASDIKRIAIYPAIMFSAVGGILSVVILFVMPKMMTILESMNVELPIFTRILVGFSGFIKHRFLLLVLLGFLIAGVIIVVLRTPRGKYAADSIKLRLPIIGPIFEKLALSRFCHYLSILHRTGIDISQSLLLVEGIIGNAVLSESVTQIRQQVMSGVQVSKAMDSSQRFPAMVVRMVAVGESSGSLADSLDKVCQYYDKDVPAATKNLFAFIEPMLIICLALAVAFIAASVYLPIYQVIGKMGK